MKKFIQKEVNNLLKDVVNNFTKLINAINYSLKIMEVVLQ